MNRTEDKLTVVSYNVKHFKEEKVAFCKDLINRCTVLCLQEHCMYSSTLTELYKLGNISFHGNSAMNEKEPLIGRPHGGCAIVWSNQLGFKFYPVDLQHDRICAVKIQLDNDTSVLLFNVYLPCDSRNRDDQYENTVDILNTISSIINKEKCDMTIVAGDLNAQLSRNTPHVQAVKNFLNNNSLHSGQDHILAEVDYTFESMVNGNKSLIDHICVCDSLFGNISMYTSVDTVENMSDHLAVMCVFDRRIMFQNRTERIHQHRAAWHKASEQNVHDYQITLDGLLMDISLPHGAVLCDDYHCPKNSSHRHDSDLLINSIVQCCIDAESQCIPRTAKKKKAGLPGWNDFVKGIHAEALHWHKLWKEAG